MNIFLGLCSAAFIKISGWESSFYSWVFFPGFLIVLLLYFAWWANSFSQEWGVAQIKVLSWAYIKKNQKSWRLSNPSANSSHSADSISLLSFHKYSTLPSPHAAFSAAPFCLSLSTLFQIPHTAECFFTFNHFLSFPLPAHKKGWKCQRALHTPSPEGGFVLEKILKKYLFSMLLTVPRQA